MTGLIASGRQGAPAAGFNLLLLSGDDHWSSAVREQAGAMGIARVTTAANAQDAVTRLSGGFPPVSHLLLQPSSAGDLLPQLVHLTAGETPNSAALVVLGEADRLSGDPSAQAMVFVADSARPWLRCALTPPAGPIPEGDGRLPLQEVRDALLGTRLQARYQPVVSLADGRPVGLEVLARLEHPVRGIVPPDLFVPQIEEAGLSGLLTEAVTRRAFEDWGHGRLAALGLTLAINFPLDVLQRPETLDWLEAYRRAAALPAELLVIELTESLPVTETGALRQAVTALRNLGYGLAIDDVGPGVRDPRLLLDLPFTILKLDMHMVRKSPDSAADAGFLTDAIAAARAANLTIVAEGVENQASWDRMRALGVDQAQGFLAARPLPAAAVPIWHRDWCARLAG